VPLYPLLLEPIYKEKVWGGRSLERFGRRLPGDSETAIGESWEVADLAATSPSGGGGAAAYSKIRNGPLIKRALGEVVKEFGSLVTGSLEIGPDGSFPLLVKYLDARENLSIQVHPSGDYAKDHPEANLKSEAWYVVDAEPGAVIYKGVVEGTTPDALRLAIEQGTVPELLVSVPVQAGDCHYLPSGTCHALGAGILVAEVQTASDTTFRVYDWGRTDRELHIEEAMACIDMGPPRVGPFEPGTRSGEGDAVARHLVECEHFAIHEWSLLRESDLSFESDELSILMVVKGEGALSWGTGQSNSLAVSAGETVVLPAALSAAAVGAQTDMTLLEITPSVG